MSTLYGVYGASGFGRETLPILRSQLAGTQAALVFIDDDEGARRTNQTDRICWQKFLDRNETEKKVSLAVADSAIRERLAERCTANAIGFVQVRAANVIELDDVTIGQGAILSPFVTLTSNIVIGCHFQANIYSYVAHDCVIGDYVTFAPAVRCNGNVHVEDHAYIGTGAVIKQGRPDRPLIIGRGSVVGMGAVVTRDVPPGATVVGNPARPFEKG